MNSDAFVRTHNGSGVG